MLYVPLFLGSFLGMSVTVAQPLRLLPDMGAIVAPFQRRSVAVSLALLLLFVAVATYRYLRYLLLGGEG